MLRRAFLRRMAEVSVSPRECDHGAAFDLNDRLDVHVTHCPSCGARVEVPTWAESMAAESYAIAMGDPA